MIDLYSHKSEKLNRNILSFSKRNMKAKDSIVNSSEIKFKNIEGAKKLEWSEFDFCICRSGNNFVNDESSVFIID